MQTQKGQIIIIVLVFMGIVVTLGIALVGYAGVEIRAHRQAVGREQGLSIAEAGIEVAIWKLNNQPGYVGETGTLFQNGEYNITLTDIAGGNKLIKVEAFIPDSTNPSAKRVVQVTATSGATNVSFNYGVQVGQGGIEMTNTSQVIGNVFTNGNIEGDNSARITGTAIVSGPTGTIDNIDIDENANAHFITNSNIGGDATAFSLSGGTVSGNVVADNLSNCNITGTATYDSKFNCSIGGVETTPNPDDFVDPEDSPLPIDDDLINEWETEAEAGGIIGSQIISSGNVSLGPIKINGNLEVKSSGKLTVTGTIWVTGEITFSNNAIVQLHSSFGSASGVILSGVEGATDKGFMNIKNNSQILGSGTEGSYLLMVSQTVEPETAIEISNSIIGAIFYGPYGVVEINNNAALKEVTAYKLEISNTATVTYETGLANVNFTSGPSGGWEILGQTWQLIQ
jgi:Tfp pilus assembly protein PilX